MINSIIRIRLILASSTTPVIDHFEKIWPLLKQALEAVLTGTTSPTNEEQLYRHIDHLCTTSSNETSPSAASQLYENLRKVLTEHIQTRVPILLSEMNDSYEYLRSLNTLWNDHIVRSVSSSRKKKKNDFFDEFSLDVNSTIVHRSRSNLRSSCCCAEYLVTNFLFASRLDIFSLFLQGVKSRTFSTFYFTKFDDFASVKNKRKIFLLFFSSTNSFRCINGLLKLIEQERQGETIDRNLMKNLVRMLIDLHVRNEIRF